MLYPDPRVGTGPCLLPKRGTVKRRSPSATCGPHLPVYALREDNFRPASIPHCMQSFVVSASFIIVLQEGLTVQAPFKQVTFQVVCSYCILSLKFYHQEHSFPLVFVARSHTADDGKGFVAIFGSGLFTTQHIILFPIVGNYPHKLFEIAP